MHGFVDIARHPAFGPGRPHETPQHRYLLLSHNYM
jgi:hypothetical protein